VSSGREGVPSAESPSVVQAPQKVVQAAKSMRWRVQAAETEGQVVRRRSGEERAERRKRRERAQAKEARECGGESECAAAEPKHKNQEVKSSRSAEFGAFEQRSRVDFEEGERSEGCLRTQGARRKGDGPKKERAGRKERQAGCLFGCKSTRVRHGYCGKRAKKEQEAGQPIGKRVFEMLGDSLEAAGKGARHLGTHEMRSASKAIGQGIKKTLNERAGEAVE
jgi:hypothetical protein